jgi:hypothetical protein
MGLDVFTPSRREVVMYEGAEPVSYEGVPHGTPVLSSSGLEFGTLAKVLEIASEDVFDGLIVKTHDGERFVDRDQISQITTKFIKCDLDDAAVAQLPEPSGSPVFRANALEDEGRTFRDWIGRTFQHHGWDEQK